MSGEEKRGLLQTSKQDAGCRDAAGDLQPRRILSRDELPKFAVHNAGKMTGTFRRVEIYDDEWYDTVFPPIKQDTKSPDDGDGNGERRAGLKPRPLQTADDADDQQSDQN